jgi:FdhD protein
MPEVHLYRNGQLQTEHTGIVTEFPLVLQVNGKELATLVASSHDLRFLVAGFLKLQGFVETADDFHLLAVCEEFGVANVRIKRELPEGLRPILTSGCGTGVTYSLEMPQASAREGVTIMPGAVFRLMNELARQADQYKNHGGIHSAAAGHPDGSLVLYAEDIGRHNTLDRIAGEALFRGIGLGGMMLATSGRVSAEMALKGARLGVGCIASRTSPTDMAVRICRQAGITLIGYLRGDRFTVYTGHERIGQEEVIVTTHKVQRIDDYLERGRCEAEQSGHIKKEAA